jgi:hypothetical protein
VQPLLQQKGTRVTYSQRVFVVLGIQHIMHMRCIVICCLSGCEYFSTLSQTQQDFRRNQITEREICFDFL